jgi:hypothetical protein
MATHDIRNIGADERDIRFNGREVSGSTWRGDSRSLGQLLRDLSEDASTLVRKEIALASAEIGEKISQVKSGITELGIGAIVMLAGTLILLQAAVYGLTMVLGNEALSALIVGGAVLLIGFLLLMAARKNLRAGNLAPERTIAAARRDGEMVREHGDRAVAEAREARERVKGVE